MSSAAYLLQTSSSSSQLPHGKKPEHILCLQSNSLPFISDCRRFRRDACHKKVGKGVPKASLWIEQKNREEHWFRTQTRAPLVGEGSDFRTRSICKLIFVSRQCQIKLLFLRGTFFCFYLSDDAIGNSPF